MRNTAYIFFRINGDVVQLQGDWTALNITRIVTELKSLSAASEEYYVDVSGVNVLDTSGAYIIRKYFKRENIFAVSKEHEDLFELVIPQNLEAFRPPVQRQSIYTCVVLIGKKTSSIFTFLYSFISFVGEVLFKLLRCFLQPRRFRLAEVSRHIYETGLSAIPIVGLLAFLMSMVISYQGALQLQQFGADIYTVDLTVISLLREMGVLITSIMVAGRSGSAFAAEIGVMKLRKEVDALDTMGIDTIEVLVLPKLIALMVTLPILTFFSNIIGIAGNALMAKVLLDIPYALYVDRASDVITPMLIFVGIIKAPVFAFLIGMICTFQGLNVDGSAESVGRLTTVAVVQSIFVVILFDALFSILFAQIGI